MSNAAKVNEAKAQPISEILRKELVTAVELDMNDIAGLWGGAAAIIVDDYMAPPI